MTSYKTTFINNEIIAKANNTPEYSFPKYTSQLMNLANRISQATRPKNVGQMSELFPLFIEDNQDVDYERWIEWYNNAEPEAIDVAVDKTYNQIEKMKEAMVLITPALIKSFIENLIYVKTYNGFNFQKGILKEIAEQNNQVYKASTPEEEAKGIDGWIGETAYSVKPESYKSMDHITEKISAKMIYYKKTKTGLELEIEQ